MYMFWEKFIELCKQANVSPSGVAREIGLSNSAAVKWKKGAIPDSNTLQKIADYFDVSVDYLLGKTPSPEREDIPEDEKRLRDLLSQMSEEQLQTALKIISAIAEQNNDNK